MSIDTHTQARPGVRPVTHRTALVAAHDVRKQYRVGKRDVEILHGDTVGPLEDFYLPLKALKNDEQSTADSTTR